MIFKWIDLLLDRMEGVGKSGTDYSQTIRIAQANLRSALKDAGKVVVTGNTGGDILVKIGEDLCHDYNGSKIVQAFSRSAPVEFFIGESPVSSPETIEHILDADAVVLIEQRNRSYLREIDETVSIIDNMGKPILGFILV